MLNVVFRRKTFMDVRWQTNSYVLNVSMEFSIPFGSFFFSSASYTTTSQKKEKGINCFSIFWPFRAVVVSFFFTQLEVNLSSVL